jgi:SAM-dependent methyltransferase
MRLHLCCGPQLLQDWVNVDAMDFGQQIVADINKRWEFTADGTVSHILCKDGFEHLESPEHFLIEAARVLEVGGTLTIVVPHYKNPSAYRMTHRRFFSWSCFAVFPEPFDRIHNLQVVSNKIYIGRKESVFWQLPHALINCIPQWWEKIGYVGTIEVVFTKVRTPSMSLRTLSLFGPFSLLVGEMALQIM